MRRYLLGVAIGLSLGLTIGQYRLNSEHIAMRRAAAKVVATLHDADEALQAADHALKNAASKLRNCVPIRDL